MNTNEIPVKSWSFPVEGSTDFPVQCGRQRWFGGPVAGVAIVASTLAPSVSFASVSTSSTTRVWLSSTNDTPGIAQYVPVSSFPTRTVHLSTSPDTSAHNEGRKQQVDFLREIKEKSGLTWDQLAKGFGVSRRTVHMWMAGGKMSAGNQERLIRLATDVRALAETGDDDPMKFLELLDRERSEHASNDEDINRPATVFKM